MNSAIEKFFLSPAYAVIGASTNRNKFGNKVLRCYLQHAKTVYAVNPRATEIENVQCFASIAALPDSVQSISVITPPTITEQMVKDAISKGIKNIWMQPGAESEAAIQTCKENNINVIANGPCILVMLGFDDNA